ncbi:hypothetical protein OA174_05145 [Actinomycetota bacterium]|nr:hypothetical protein [Actinomycetota bacterium]
MKRLLIPALLASSAFVLSGCLDVDADLSVNEDATATGEMTIAISSEISGLLGLGSGVDLVDQLKQGMLDGAEGVEDLDCEPAEQENAVAMVCSFENQVFDQADDIWNIYVSDDNTVTFYSSSGEQAAEEDAGLFDDLVDFDFGGYQIDVEMPGPIVSVDGTNVDQTSDTNFRIEAGLNDSFEAVVVSEDGSSSFPWVLLIVVGVAVLAVIALVVFLIGRSRSSGGSDANDPNNSMDGTSVMDDADRAQPELIAATPALDSPTPPPAVEASPVPPAIESGDALSDDAPGVDAPGDDNSDDNSSDDAPADTADDSPGHSPADNDDGGSVGSNDNDDD